MFDEVLNALLHPLRNRFSKKPKLQQEIVAKFRF